jgi:hypothetical protein
MDFCSHLAVAVVPLIACDGSVVSERAYICCSVPWQKMPTNDDGHKVGGRADKNTQQPKIASIKGSNGLLL